MGGRRAADRQSLSREILTSISPKNQNRLRDDAPTALKPLATRNQLEAARGSDGYRSAARAALRCGDRWWSSSRSIPRIRSRP